jgi:hypothetical protein
MLLSILLLLRFTSLAQEATKVSFRAVDIFVNSGNAPLAAYQLTFLSTNEDARIVGIEGGEHEAFAEAPYYDPKAMQSNQVVIAAFNVAGAGQLPSGRMRIATIHLQAGTNVSYTVTAGPAAAADGTRIKINVEAKEGTR